MRQPVSIIAERIRYRMLEKGINAMELARRSNVKPSFLYDIMNGKSSNPSVVKLSRVAHELDVGLEYILGTSTREHAQGNGPAGDTTGGFVLIHALRAPHHTTYGQEADSTSITQCFAKSWLQQHVRCAPDDLKMLTITGDSMEPTLVDGDQVLVDTSRKHPSPPGIFIVFDGLGFIAKRIELVTNASPATIRMLSDNTRYGSSIHELASTRIIGRVVWFSRQL